MDRPSRSASSGSTNDEGEWSSMSGGGLFPSAAFRNLYDGLCANYPDVAVGDLIECCKAACFIYWDIMGGTG